LRELQAIIVEVGQHKTEDSRGASSWNICANAVNTWRAAGSVSLENMALPTNRIKSDSKKGILEKFEKRDWVPLCLSKEGIVAEEVNELGSIWYHLQEPTSIRRTHSKMIFDGMGRFILGMEQCDVCVMCWPMQSVFDLGSSTFDSHEFFEKMPEKDFIQWAEANITHCRVTRGGACWVPYGFACNVVAVFIAGEVVAQSQVTHLHYSGLTEEDDTAKCLWSNYISFPLINRKLFERLPLDTRAAMARHPETSCALNWVWYSYIYTYMHICICTGQYIVLGTVKY